LRPTGAAGIMDMAEAQKIYDEIVDLFANAD
jgi:hypothetical protein